MEEQRDDNTGQWRVGVALGHTNAALGEVRAGRGYGSCALREWRRLGRFVAPFATNMTNDRANGPPLY